MCSCASCTVTDKLHDAGFAAWPRGNPAGRKSAADYADHVAHSKQWHSDSDGAEIPASLLELHPEPRYPHLPGLVGPLPSPSPLVRDWIASSYAWADNRNLFPGPSVRAVRKSTRPLLALAQQLRKAA